MTRTVTLVMDADEARALWNAGACAVQLLDELGDGVPPSASLYGQGERLTALLRRLDHEINHAPAAGE